MAHDAEKTERCFIILISYDKVVFFVFHGTIIFYEVTVTLKIWCFNPLTV